MATATTDSPTTTTRAARPAAAKRSALVALAAALLYAALKANWGLGGTVGLTGELGGPADPWLRFLALEGTAIVALGGGLLAVALVQPWGRFVPRWLLTVPAALGSALLVAVGLAGTYDNVVSALDPSPAAADQIAGIAPWVYTAIYPTFLVWGVALSLTVWLSRTRAGGGAT